MSHHLIWIHVWIVLPERCNWVKYLVPGYVWTGVNTEKGQKEEALEMDGLEAGGNNSKWSEVSERNIGARKEFTSIGKHYLLIVWNRTIKPNLFWKVWHITQPF